MPISLSIHEHACALTHILHARTLFATQCLSASTSTPAGNKYALAGWVLMKVLLKVVEQRPVCKHTVAVEKERLRLVNVP